MLISFAVTLSLLSACSGFNLAAEKSIVMEGDSDKSIYFGYSMALNKSTLFVGAPGQDAGMGAVYRCDFEPNSHDSQRAFCSVILRQATRTSGTNRDFLGASLLLSRRRDALFACAPRRFSENFEKLSSVTGECVVSRRDADDFESIFRLRNPRPSTGWTFFTMMGHSLVEAEDAGIVIGLPMARANVFSWTTEHTTGHLAKLYPSSSLLSIPRPESVSWGQLYHSSKSDPHTYDLTGTSVARGRFYYRGRDHYVIGAPKADNLRGRVYLCIDCFGHQKLNVFLEELRGEQIGARFGQSVLAVDLDGDNFDEIVVGAPLHAHPQHYDTGLVYVYQTVVRGHTTQVELLTSSLERAVESGARFGAALALVGDVDNDGFGDFAVAAPFEDGNRGVVYLYRGSGNLLIREYSQRIAGRDVLPRPLGFGFSMAGNVDVDDNEHDDLAVSSVFSGQAVLIRAKRSVRIEPLSTAKGPDKAVNPEDEEFVVEVRAELESPISHFLRVDVEYRNLDSRLSTDIETKQSSVLRPGQLWLGFRSLMRSRTRKFGVDSQVDLPRPIRLQVQITWTVDETQENECRNLGCPMIDPRNRRVEDIELSIPLLTGCTSISVCKCDLEVEDGLVVQRLEHVLGSGRRLATAMAVRNHGQEPAYDAVVRIVASHPIPAPYNLVCDENDFENNGETNIESNGNKENNVFNVGEQSPEFVTTCKLPSIKGDTVRTITLIFDLNLVDNLSSAELAISTELISNCDASSQQPTRSLTKLTRVNLIYETELRLEGSSNQRQLSYNKSEVAFKHDFELVNFGPSTTREEVKVDFYVPISPFVKFEPSQIGKEDFGCTGSQSSRFHAGLKWSVEGNQVGKIDCSTAQSCQVLRCSTKAALAKNERAHLSLALFFVPEEDAEQHRFAVRSIGVLDNSDDTVVGVTTELYDVDAPLALLANQTWQYILGSVLGLLLLGALIGAIWRFGLVAKLRFFKKNLDMIEENNNKQEGQQAS